MRNRTLQIEAVVAFDRTTYGIGSGNELLWKLPKDMKRFKAITTGHAVLMGYQTALSCKRPLPHRTNLILTHRDESPYEGQITVASMQAAVNHVLEGATEEHVKLYVIGGESVYRQMMPYLTGIHATCVYNPPALTPDRFFPFEEYQTFFGTKAINTIDGDWIADGPKGELDTQYRYVTFSRREGPPLLTLPAGWQLGAPVVFNYEY